MPAPSLYPPQPPPASGYAPYSEETQLEVGLDTQLELHDSQLGIDTQPLAEAGGEVEEMPPPAFDVATQPSAPAYTFGGGAPALVSAQLTARVGVMDVHEEGDTGSDSDGGNTGGSSLGLVRPRG
jgi:hypothetical protein